MTDLLAIAACVVAVCIPGPWVVPLLVLYGIITLTAIINSIADTP